MTESLAVRNKVGVFDVSHMGRMTLEGDDSCKFLERVTTNYVASLKVRDGHYSLICNEEGGIKDDLMIFRLADYKYLVVYNAANRSKDYDWFLKNVEGKVELRDISDKTAMFAIQGPNSVDVLQKIGCELRRTNPQILLHLERNSQRKMPDYKNRVYGRGRIRTYRLGFPRN